MPSVSLANGEWHEFKKNTITKIVIALQDKTKPAIISVRYGPNNGHPNIMLPGKFGKVYYDLSPPYDGKVNVTITNQGDGGVNLSWKQPGT